MTPTMYAAFAVALAVIALSFFHAQPESAGVAVLISGFQVYLFVLAFEIFRVILGKSIDEGATYSR